jgi:hypothetical protein
LDVAEVAAVIVVDVEKMDVDPSTTVVSTVGEIAKVTNDGCIVAGTRLVITVGTPSVVIVR